MLCTQITIKTWLNNEKVFIAAALAAMIVSCGSKGNKSAEIIAESESDSIFAVNDSTLGELQTYSYEGILPAADAEGINYQLTLQEAGQDSLGTYNLTTTYLGTKMVTRHLPTVVQL